MPYLRCSFVPPKNQSDLFKIECLLKHVHRPERIVVSHALWWDHVDRMQNRKMIDPFKKTCHADQLSIPIIRLDDLEAAFVRVGYSARHAHHRAELYCRPPEKQER